MRELLNKLSSYNIFNYLLPGIVFVVLAEKFSGYSFVQQDIVLGAFLYYFVGLVISRIGSLIIEPILKKFTFVKFSEYREFVNASKKDEKLELLSEVNNTYRTLSALFISFLALRVYELIERKIPILEEWSQTLLVVFLLLIFLFSYKKQTSYIASRIEANR